MEMLQFFINPITRNKGYLTNLPHCKSLFRNIRFQQIFYSSSLQKDLDVCYMRSSRQVLLAMRINGDVSGLVHGFREVTESSYYLDVF